MVSHRNCLIYSYLISISIGFDKHVAEWRAKQVLGNEQAILDAALRGRTWHWERARDPESACHALPNVDMLLLNPHVIPYHLVIPHHMVLSHVGPDTIKQLPYLKDKAKKGPADLWRSARILQFYSGAGKYPLAISVMPGLLPRHAGMYFLLTALLPAV